MVGAGAFYPTFAILDAAPEIAAAYDYPDLNAELNAFLYRLANTSHYVKVKACLSFAG